MILFELCGQTENHPIYQGMSVANGNRHYSFLASAVETALTLPNGDFLSQTLLKAINYHAIACLHPYAGEYRPCSVKAGERRCPEHYRVSTMMDDLVNRVNRNWESAEATTLAAIVIWGLNYIHPFINGNGRTARAAGHFVLCMKAGEWLPGQKILPELIRSEEHYEDYIAALRHAHDIVDNGKPREGFLEPMIQLLDRLLLQQLSEQ